MLKLPAAFRNPRETTFRRTPCVARRVIGSSNIRTCRVASLALKAILVTKETQMLKLETAFRNPRETNFRRTLGVVPRVITTCKMRTFSILGASAVIVSSWDTIPQPLRARGWHGVDCMETLFFAQSALRTKAKNA